MIIFILRIFQVKVTSYSIGTYQKKITLINSYLLQNQIYYLRHKFYLRSINYNLFEW